MEARLTSLTHMSCLSSWIELPLISDKNITIGCRTFRRPLFIICSISLLFHYWTVYETVANVVSHSMAHGSKCRLFIGQYRVAYNKVIKTWRMLRLKPIAWRGEGIVVRLCYRSVRSSKMREGFVSILKNGCTLCFLADVQFVSLHPIWVLLLKPQVFRSRI